MKRYWSLLALMALIGSGLFQGCNRAGANATTTGAGATNAAPVNPLIPTQAQPKLATIKLWIGREEMITEMAISEIQERTGMMFRTNMAENEGMIFVMDQPKQANFWMMNTILPLSAAYIDADGKILEIHDMQPHNTNSVISTNFNIQFVLETRQGWFQRHNIKVGTVISTEKGPLKKTFLERK